MPKTTFEALLSPAGFFRLSVMIIPQLIEVCIQEGFL
jgi:hypothetical protein